MMKKPTYTAQLVNISGDESKMQGRVYLLTLDWFGKRVGSLEMKGKKVHFKGNADKSARAFFIKLIEFIEEYIEMKLKKMK